MRSPECDPTQIQIEIARIKALLLEKSFSGTQALKFYKDELGHLPPEWQGLAYTILVDGYAIGVDLKETRRQELKNTQLWSAVAVGFLLLGVLTALFRKDMNSFQQIMSALLAALGSAGLLVNLPGFLELNGLMSPNELFDSMKFKAGGGVAIFVVVFALMMIVMRTLS